MTIEDQHLALAKALAPEDSLDFSNWNECVRSAMESIKRLEHSALVTDFVSVHEMDVDEKTISSLKSDARLAAHLITKPQSYIAATVTKACSVDRDDVDQLANWSFASTANIIAAVVMLRIKSLRVYIDEYPNIKVRDVNVPDEEDVINPDNSILVAVLKADNITSMEQADKVMHNDQKLLQSLGSLHNAIVASYTQMCSDMSRLVEEASRKASTYARIKSNVKSMLELLRSLIVRFIKMAKSKSQAIDKAFNKIIHLSKQSISDKAASLLKTGAISSIGATLAAIGAPQLTLLATITAIATALFAFGSMCGDAAFAKKAESVVNHVLGHNMRSNPFNDLSSVSLTPQMQKSMVQHLSVALKGLSLKQYKQSETAKALYEIRVRSASLASYEMYEDFNLADIARMRCSKGFNVRDVAGLYDYAIRLKKTSKKFKLVYGVFPEHHAICTFIISSTSSDLDTAAKLRSDWENKYVDLQIKSMDSHASGT